MHVPCWYEKKQRYLRQTFYLKCIPCNYLSAQAYGTTTNIIMIDRYISRYYYEYQVLTSIGGMQKETILVKPAILPCAITAKRHK